MLLCCVASQVVAHSDTESIRDAISLLGHTFLPALLLSLEQAPVTPIPFVLSRLTMSSVLMMSLCLKILLDLLQPACHMCVHVYTVHSCGVPPLRGRSSASRLLLFQQGLCGLSFCPISPPLMCTVVYGRDRLVAPTALWAYSCSMGCFVARTFVPPCLIFCMPPLPQVVVGFVKVLSLCSTS